MPDVVVAGHVSLDLYPELHGPVNAGPGQLVVIGPAAVSTGGSVSNTGVALHRLGADVRLAGKVGTDLFGRALLDGLEHHGRGLAGEMVVTAGEVTSYTIVLGPPGVDRSFLHCPGANATFAAADVPDRLLAGARLFHFGYPPLMPRMYADGGAELRALFARVHAAGPATSLDMCALDPDDAAGRVDWEAVLRATLPHVDVFAPSLDELLYMVDRPDHERLLAGGFAAVVEGRLLAALADRLIALGGAVVAIKLGEHGLYLRTAPDRRRIDAFARRTGVDAGAWTDREVLAPCFVPDPLAGTTGSGDATIGGLLAAVLRGDDAAEAATAATAVGACSVERVDPTSGIPPWPQIAARIAGGWARAPSAVATG